MGKEKWGHSVPWDNLPIQRLGFGCHGVERTPKTSAHKPRNTEIREMIDRKKQSEIERKREGGWGTQRERERERRVRNRFREEGRETDGHTNTDKHK